MSADMPDADTYALKSAAVAEIPAPELDYRPPMPRAYRPRIALIGAGGIAGAHLDAYRTAGFDVPAQPWRKASAPARGRRMRASLCMGEIGGPSAGISASRG